MLGAIAGDILGSTFERHGVKTTEIPLFPDGSTFTDDSVLTVATAEQPTPDLFEGGRIQLHFGCDLVQTLVLVDHQQPGRAADAARVGHSPGALALIASA